MPGFAACAARAMPADRRALLDSAESGADFAEGMYEFRQPNEFIEMRAFGNSFVNAIPVRPGQATRSPDRLTIQSEAVARRARPLGPSQEYGSRGRFGPDGQGKLPTYPALQSAEIGIGYHSGAWLPSQSFELVAADRTLRRRDLRAPADPSAPPPAFLRRQ